MLEPLFTYTYRNDVLKTSGRLIGTEAAIRDLLIMANRAGIAYVIADSVGVDVTSRFA